MIETCVCGEQAHLGGNAHGYYWGECNDPECWEGPLRESEEDAVDAWNQVMAAAKAAKAGEREDK